MPDRIIRDELLTSDRWLSLKDNADRLAFLACALTCDTLGNMEATPQRLVRLWRDFGIGSAQHVEQTLLNLVDLDLVRAYEHDGKRYLHIPRFRQSRRYLGRLNPLSPWTTHAEKQAIAENSQRARTDGARRAHGDHPVRTAGVGVGVGLGLERGGVGVPGVIHRPATSEGVGQGPIDRPGKVNGNGKAQTAAQLALFAIGRGLGLEPSAGELFREYEARVMAEQQRRQGAGADDGSPESQGGIPAAG